MGAVNRPKNVTYEKRVELLPHLNTIIDVCLQVDPHGSFNDDECLMKYLSSLEYFDSKVHIIKSKKLVNKIITESKELYNKLKAIEYMIKNT